MDGGGGVCRDIGGGGGRWSIELPIIKRLMSAYCSVWLRSMICTPLSLPPTWKITDIPKTSTQLALKPFQTWRQTNIWLVDSKKIIKTFSLLNCQEAALTLSAHHLIHLKTDGIEYCYYMPIIVFIILTLVRHHMEHSHHSNKHLIESNRANICIKLSGMIKHYQSMHFIFNA